MLASKDVGIDVIAAVVDRSEKTVKDWLRDWRARRLGSVVTGHAGNENAAKLAQKEEVRAALAAKPSESGVPVEFWDVPALENLVRTRFGIEYRSDSSLHLLMKFCGMSFKLPDPFDKRRDEEAITARMIDVRDQVAGLLAAGVEVFTADEVRVEHEAEMRRTWLPIGERTKVYVNRERDAKSFFGALNLRTGKMMTYRIDGNQNTGQTVLALDRLQRACPGKRIAIVWDNAGWHTSKELMRWFEPGQQFEDVTLIKLPPYAPATTRPSTSGIRPRERSRTFSDRPRTTPSAPSSHSSRMEPSSTTSNTSRFRQARSILFNCGHTGRSVLVGRTKFIARNPDLGTVSCRGATGTQFCGKVSKPVLARCPGCGWLGRSQVVR
jgi:transposase